MQTGERQVAPTRDGIRRDHVARYEWAAKQLTASSRVVDLACGVGYGTQLLAEYALEVVGLDKSGDALAYARRHYPHTRAKYWSSTAHRLSGLGRFDVAVCFETIEHIEHPEPLLRSLRDAAPTLLVSVPNEDGFPWNGHAFHYRHYTPMEFESLLNECGWSITEWWSQQGPESEVESGLKTGRTLIAVAQRSAEKAKSKPKLKMKAERHPTKPTTAAAPRHVAILGMGPSVSAYLEITKRLGGRRRYCDETWVINALGNVFEHDRVFHMDDVRIQEIRAKAAPDGNIAALLPWLERHPGPVVTSRAHPGYPGLVEFPLQAVVNQFNRAYFNSTAAYAIAYACHIGVQKLSIFGMDFTYPNSHTAEKGRACVEYWLGIAASLGIDLVIPRTSSLMDAMGTQADRLYGYDTLDVQLAGQANGQVRVSFTPRDELPTAAEIEARYDHSKHPSALMSR